MSAVETRDRLNADNLQASLGDVVIGREIVVLEQTGSTNDVAWRMAKGESREGLVIFAEHQTAGRGQRGNRWESAAGKGLWFSVLLSSKVDLADSPRLTQWAANVVATTIQDEFSLNAVVKSPNDVYVDDRKVAGVLVEMRARENAPHAVILGIGVNVNHQRQDFSEELQGRAASLAMLRGGSLDRHSFALALLRRLDRTYAAAFG